MSAATNPIRVNVNTVSIKLGENASNTAAFQNPKVLVNGMQFGTTQAVISGGTTYSFAVFRFSETSDVESVKVTQLNVVDSVASTASVKPDFNNLKLYNGSTLLGTAQSAVADASGTGYIYSFTSLTYFIIPQGNSVSLTLKGDAGSYTNGSLSDNTTSTFMIATTTDSSNNTTALAVVARGATSNKTAITTLLNASGNPMTTLRSTLAVSGSSVNGLPPASFQQMEMPRSGDDKKAIKRFYRLGL
ncbi:MAG: hypothetical protein WCF77_05420 [Minisyncoccia bacterium]